MNLVVIVLSALIIHGRYEGVALDAHWSDKGTGFEIQQLFCVLAKETLPRILSILNVIFQFQPNHGSGN